MATAMATIPQNVIPVTREGHRLLTEQLTTPTTQGRADASERVRQARADDGNLAENPELIFALQAQEQLERRISGSSRSSNASTSSRVRAETARLPSARASISAGPVIADARSSSSW